MRGCFVTGTDTGVGKTVVSAAIVAVLRDRGLEVTALKPVITGLDDPSEPDWPPDHELLARLAGSLPEQTALMSYGPPVSPHLAATLAGRPLELPALVEAIRSRAIPGRQLIVEGVGGLLVPLSDHASVRDLARGLGLPVVIAARPGLGTINHTLLTLEAARAAGLEVAAVVLTPWPERPGQIERSNLETIEALGQVPVATLGRVSAPTAPELIRAAAGLSLDRWLR
jgi:dethiobiotin synthetase